MKLLGPTMQEDSLPLHVLHMVSVVIHSLCKYQLTSPLIREKRQVGPGREKGGGFGTQRKKKKGPPTPYRP